MGENTQWINEWCFNLLTWPSISKVYSTKFHRKSKRDVYFSYFQKMVMNLSYTDVNAVACHSNYNWPSMCMLLPDMLLKVCYAFSYLYIPATLRNILKRANFVPKNQVFGFCAKICHFFYFSICLAWITKKIFCIHVTYKVIDLWYKYKVGYRCKT